MCLEDSYIFAVLYFLLGWGQRAEFEFGFSTLRLRDLKCIHLEIHGGQLKSLEHRRGVLAGGERRDILRTWRWRLKLWE